MRSNALVFVSCLLFTSAAVFGSDMQDLRGLAEAALRNDPNRLQAAELLQSAEADAAAERSRRILSGSLSANISKSDVLDSTDAGEQAVSAGVSASTHAPAGSVLSLGAQYFFTDTDAAELDSTELKASLELPVFLNKRLIDLRLNDAAKASMVEIPLERARRDTEADRNNTVSSVFQRALQAASAERIMRNAEKAADLARREVLIAQVERSLGMLSFLELNKIQKDADDAEIAALEARLNFDMRIRSLAAATGLDVEQLHLEGLKAPAPQEITFSIQQLEQAPSYIAAQNERRRADASRILSGAEYAPSFSLSGSYSIPGSHTLDLIPDEKSDWSVSAGVSIPLNPYTNIKRIKSADASLSAAYQREAAVRLQLMNSYQDAMNAYEAAQAKEKLRQQQLDQARRNVQEVQSAFESENATQLDVERAQLYVDETAAALEDDRSSRFFAALELASLLGINPMTLLDSQSL